MPAAAPAHDQATRFQRTFCGRTDQVSQVRRDITAYLHNCPAADDLILIADELAANAILHTQSRGRAFTVRCQLAPRACASTSSPATATTASAAVNDLSADLMNAA